MTINTAHRQGEATGGPRADAYRLVSRLTQFSGPVDATQLLASVVTAETRYLVFDLDRTIHRGVNMGELLGWEVIAWQHWGERVFEPRGVGRLRVDGKHPAVMARYVSRGARLWAVPGLRYLFGVKLGSRAAWSRRLAFRQYGPDVVESIQRTAREVAMQHLSEAPMPILRRLAALVWDRHESLQVFTRAHLDALRLRYPKLKIVLSTASPLPTAEIAKERLGVDHVLHTSVPIHEGQMSAPYRVDWRHGMDTLPRQIAAPAAVVHNAAAAKVPKLRALFPDFDSPTVETVGITDTGHGEDQDWARHFTHVVDVNTQHPFSPIVLQRSPLQSITSADVRPSAQPTAQARTMSASALHAEATHSLAAIEKHERLRAKAYAEVTVPVAAVNAALDQLHKTIAMAVEDYNGASLKRRPLAFDRLARLGRIEDELHAKRAHHLRSVSRHVCAIRDLQAHARLRVQQPVIAPADKVGLAGLHRMLVQPA